MIEFVGFRTSDTPICIPNVKVYEVGNIVDFIRVAWSTETGTDQIESFTVSVKYKGWYKGYTTTTGWSAVRTHTFPAAELRSNLMPGKPDNRYSWETDFNWDGLLQEMAGGSTWDYDHRIYDTIEINVAVTANHTKAYIDKYKEKTTGPAYFDGWVGYFPAYYMTRLYYESSDLLVAEYETTWERIDDRWCLEWLEDDLGDVVPRGEIWGHIAQKGRIEIPVSKLNRHIKGKYVDMRIRFNATYRVANSFFSIGYFEGVCEDLSICNTPYLALVGTPTEYGTGVRIKTGDRNDLGAPIEQVTVKLRYGKYSFHQKTVDVGEIASFPDCPLNTELIFDAVGSRGKATSAVATLKVAPIRSEYGWLTHEPSGEMVELKWRTTSDDRGISVKASSNHEIVNLARRRPSAMWGPGGSTHVSITRAFLRDQDGLRLVDQLEQFVDLGGVFIIRDPDGHVYAIAGEIEITNPAKDYWKVTISGDEVDA